MADHTDMRFEQSFFDTVLLSEGVQELQDSITADGLARARATAPVDSGDYQDGLRIRKVRRRYRYATLIEGTDPKTLLVESKTGNLARTLKSMGRG